LIGKSVLCSYIVSFLQARPGITTAYFFCDCHNEGRDILSEILRTLALQILRAHKDLVPHVFETYANRGLTPSITQLKKLLSEFLVAVPSIRIVIDGLDECSDSDQKIILKEAVSLFTGSEGRCKILISSRECVHISKRLRNKPMISFTERRAEINGDIKLYVSQALEELRHRFGRQIVNDVEQKILEKAAGMYLKYRLPNVS
jgi:hypothetical protein